MILLTLSLALVLFNLSESSECLKWKCDKEVPDNFCFQYNEKTKTVLVAENFHANCSVINYIEGLAQNKNMEVKQVESKMIKEEDYLEVYLRQKYCSLDFNSFLGCSRWCYKKRIGKKTRRYCNFDGYIATIGHKSQGKNRYSICTNDSECSSQKCECVPSQQGISRCTTSAYDEMYKDLWSNICQQNYLGIDDGCKQYIAIKFGHLMVQLQPNSTDLPCLGNSTDARAFQHLKTDLEQGEILMLGIFIALIAAFLLICFIIKCNSKRGRIARGVLFDSNLKQPLNV